MRTILALFLIASSAAAQQISVQYAVAARAEKAGLGYNFERSSAQTDPECRRWVTTLPPDTLPFADAMKQLLDPVWLRYEVEDGKVVLYRNEREIDLKTARVTYSTPRQSVQYIVDALARQVGLGYNFEKSFAQTDPIAAASSSTSQ